MAGTEDGTPCAACPWVSQDPRDREAVAAPATQAAMEAGTWFCCHVDLGTCHGARLLHERHMRRQATAQPSTA